MQALTTREPDDEMIEVAIQSVEAVFDWEAYLDENFPYRRKHGKKKGNKIKKAEPEKKVEPEKKAESEKKEQLEKKAEVVQVASDEIAASLEPEEDDEILSALDHYFLDDAANQQNQSKE